MDKPSFLKNFNYVDYRDAEHFMLDHVHKVIHQEKNELIWFLEHPPLYTGGTSALPQHLLKLSYLPIYETGRGGSYTYHGPGQRVAYLMLNLIRFQKDLRAYVKFLENWIIQSLAHFGLQARTYDGRVGVWVDHKGTQKKIAAIGIRVKKWVSFHGIALNVFPNLDHFQGIIPCGLHQYKVTSLEDLSIHVSMEEVDYVLKQELYKHLPFLKDF
jgi:lipoyl(octanoyl) transferase